MVDKSGFVRVPPRHDRFIVVSNGDYEKHIYAMDTHGNARPYATINDITGRATDGALTKILAAVLNAGGPELHPGSDATQQERDQEVEKLISIVTQVIRDTRA